MLKSYDQDKLARLFSVRDLSVEFPNFDTYLLTATCLQFSNSKLADFDEFGYFLAQNVMIFGDF